MPASTIEAPNRPQPTSVEVTESSAAATTKHLAVGESVTRGALALLSTQPLTWGASLLTTAFAPRLLGADGLGQLTIAATSISLVAIATSLGVSEYLVRRVAQRPVNLQQDLGVALLLQIMTALVAALLITLAAPFLAASFIEPRLLYISLVGLFVAPPQTVLSSAFRGRELHAQYAWFNAGSVVIGQILGLLVLVAGGGVLGYAAMLAVVPLVATLVGWKLSGLRPSLPSFTDGALMRACREFALGGFPFMTGTLTLAISSGIDRVLLGWFVPTAEVGWYAAAYRIFAIPVFIPTLIITPLFPALSRSVHDPETIRQMIAKTVRVVLLLMVPLSAGTIVIAPAIPSLFGWPADFDNAVPLMALLALQLPIIAVDMVFGAMLMAIALQNRWVVVGLTAAALKILLDFVAIPAFENFYGSGAVGAAMVSLLTELVMLAGALAIIPKHLLDLHVVWDVVRIGLAGAATVVVGVALLPHALILSVLGGAVTYVAIVVALRALTLEDIQPLGRRLLRMLPNRS